MSRSWPVFGVKVDKTTPEGEPFFVNVTKYIQALQMSGFNNNQIVKLTAVEDANGAYTGWIDAKKDFPIMIQVNEIFGVSFSTTIDNKIAAGQGYPVKLSLIVRP